MSKKPAKRITQPKQSSNLASRLQEISNDFDKKVMSDTNESSERHQIHVRKRDKTLEPVSFDKIKDRILNLSDDLSVDATSLAQEVIQSLYDGMETRELDVLSARIAHNRCFIHPDWDKLASRISVSNHHKETSGVFSEVIFELNRNNLVSDQVCELVRKNETVLNNVVDYARDYALDYIGFQYFLSTYADRTILIDENGTETQGPVIERFQDLLLKVSLGIHRDDIDAAIETYQYYSCLLFTHASPTIFNAAKDKSQCSSCFLLAMKEEEDWPYDSITKIYETLSDCAKISKLAGGIGVSISNVRGKGTIIHSVGRPSSGIVPMLRVFNETARYVDQGRRRKGAFAFYLEPYHPDIIDFLQLRKDDGAAESMRTKDLFTALWIPDLFMKRVEAGEIWSLIDPSVCPELYKTHSEEFEEHYLRCEREKKYVKQMPARTLFYEMVVAQVESGTPYMMFKDHVNRKSNQKNLGTLRQSNLCAEICEYTDSYEQAVCNLVSICLPRYIDADGDKLSFNHDLLYEATKILTRNLNKVIDINFYPNDETKRSNFRHRPIGIGIQGLSDTFYKMKYAFESPEAAKLNSEIAETIYFAALEASNELAEEDGTYESYVGSPLSEGLFQFDLWNDSKVSDRWNWKQLKENIKRHGVRNSLLVALMPTASTSFLMGCNESFEPISSNYYVTGGIVGSFKRINKYLVSEMISRGLWTEEIRNMIVANNGSVQNIPGIPMDIAKLFKTIWEVPQRVLVDLSAERGRFTCQSQSLNIYLVGDRDEDGNLDTKSLVSKLSSLHMYAWKKGLKTGMYYLRTQAARDAVKSVIDPSLMKKQPKKELSLEEQKAICSRDNKEDCLMCGS